MKFKNKSELQTAVNEWTTNKTTAKDKYGDINTWDTSLITNMTELFQGKHTFNDDIGSWDVSNVIYMEGMFEGATSFNQPIGKWNTDNVYNISSVD